MLGVVGAEVMGVNFAFQEVVSPNSAIQPPHRYCCTVVCPSCGREEMLVHGESVPECCCLGPMLEDPAKRVLIQVSRRRMVNCMS